jgi:hypothetical protein
MFAFCFFLFNTERTFIKKKSTQPDIYIRRVPLHEAQFHIKILHPKTRRS